MSTTEENGTELVDKRIEVYGDPAKTFERIAQVWTGIIGHPVTAVQVVLCMNGMKAVRTEVCPEYSDNSDDMDGYVNILRKIVGDKMVKADSVKEFITRRDHKVVTVSRADEFAEEAVKADLMVKRLEVGRCRARGWHNTAMYHHQFECYQPSKDTCPECGSERRNQMLDVCARKSPHKWHRG